MGDSIMEITDLPAAVTRSTTSTTISPSIAEPPQLTSSTPSILDTFKSTHYFFHSIRGLIILLVLGLIAVLILISIGYLFCCCLRRYKRVKKQQYSIAVSGPSGGGVIDYGGGGGTSNAPYTQYGGGGAGGGAWNRASTGSTQSTASGSKKLLIPHKNIITPDKNLPFVVPMISLHQTQPQSGPFRSASAPMFYGSSAAMSKPPLQEEQYFPQYHLEDTTAPQVGFSLSYQVSSQILKVRIIGGNNFPYESEGCCHSIHVKVYPGRGSKHRTKEFPGSSPIYNQEFGFHVRKDTLKTKVLKLRVIGQNFSINTPSQAGSSVPKSSQGGNSEPTRSASIRSTVSNLSTVSAGKNLVGIINVALKDLPMVGQFDDIREDFKTGPVWKILEHPSSFGEGIKLDVTLKWSEEPSPGLLVMKIREAYGLHEITEAEYTTTYVKVTLQEQGRSIKNRKTRLIRWGSQPNYDDTFVVTIPYELLSQISFTLALIARGKLGSKVILGKISIGPVPYVSPQSGFAAGAEIWEDMCHQKNTEVTRWLPLLIS